MTPKDILTNKAFCPLPWTGFVVMPDGNVKNCICAYDVIGNVRENTIEQVMTGEINTKIKQQIINREKPTSCGYCYNLEENKTSHDIVSSRIYYMKELRSVDPTLYDDPTNFNLNQIDVRWRNTCNFACVYCFPVFSSKWASELGVKIDRVPDEKFKQLKEYIFNNAHQIKNVYLAGGEPMLIKENEQLLEILLEKNPEVNIRINTNLSSTDTNVLELLCQFKNVHWTVSIENLDKEFEYTRYGSSWQDFLKNLETIKQLPHKITFNMVWCILNTFSVFDCIDYFMAQDFHPNAFVLTTIVEPEWIDCRHLPESVLNLVEEKLNKRIADKPGFLLEDGYRNLLAHIRSPFTKDMKTFWQRLSEIDARRNLDSSKIFTELYKLKEGN